MSIPKGWEEVELKNACEINPKSGEIPQEFIYIDLESVVSGDLLKINQMTKDKAPSRARRVLQKNDVIFQMVRPYQKNNFYFDLSGDFVASTGYAQLRCDKNNSKFLYYALHEPSFVNKVVELCTGSNYPAINQEDLSGIKIKLPPLKEQEKIAEILSSCDEHIKNLKNLKSELEKEKLHLMNELLSGKTRFNSFTTPWQEVTLADICEIKNGFAFKSSKFQDSGIPIVRISNLSNSSNFMDMGNVVYYEEDKALEQFLIKKGDVLIAMSGATTGKVAIYNLDYQSYLNQRVGKFVANSKASQMFLAYYLISDIFYAQLQAIIVAGAQPNISSNSIKEFRLKLPSLEEQKKIGEVLSACDERLEYLNELITAQTTLKSHLLTELLSGNIRV